MNDENELIRLRREKLDALRARGTDPFGGRYPVTHWARDLAERLGNANDEELTLRAFRKSKIGNRVVVLRDGKQLPVSRSGHERLREQWS